MIAIRQNVSAQDKAHLHYIGVVGVKRAIKLGRMKALVFAIQLSVIAPTMLAMFD